MKQYKLTLNNISMQPTKSSNEGKYNCEFQVYTFVYTILCGYMHVMNRTFQVHTHVCSRRLMCVLVCKCMCVRMCVCVCVCVFVCMSACVCVHCNVKIHIQHRQD